MLLKVQIMWNSMYFVVLIFNFDYSTIIYNMPTNLSFCFTRHVSETRGEEGWFETKIDSLGSSRLNCTSSLPWHIEERSGRAQAIKYQVGQMGSNIIDLPGQQIISLSLVWHPPSSVPSCNSLVSFLDPWMADTVPFMGLFVLLSEL